MSESEKVVLREIRLPDIQIHLSAWIDDDGDLRLEGQDLGRRVEEIWSNSDYEYFLTVKAGHLDQVLELLHADLSLGDIKAENATERPRLLLQALGTAYTRQRFKGTSDFRAWLAGNGIPSSAFNW